MKIKIDFVTNSSSSSFIVAWPKPVKTMDDVLKYIPEYTKAKVVYEDAIKYASPKPLKIEKNKKVVELLMRLLSEGYWGQASIHYSSDIYEQVARREGVTEKEIMENPQWSAIVWDEQKKKTDIAGKEKAHNFIRQTNGYYLYVFQYGDEDGEFYSEMEHGGTFSNLPHIQVSHH